MVRKNGLPRRVYIKHGAYYFVGTDRKWRRLSSTRDGLPAMYRALASLQEANSIVGEMMPAMISAWLEHKRASWSVKQAKDMERMADVISRRFVEFRPADVTTRDCDEFLSEYAGKPRTHNIYRNMLRQILAWTAIKGLRADANPIANIKGKSTPGRRRIVSDAEVAAIRKVAMAGTRKDSAGRALVQMMDLALITGQRIGDLLKLRWQDVSDAGIYIEQGKTRARLLIEWSPALRAVVASCATGTNKIGHLLKTSTGSQYTYAGMRSAWDRACKAAKVEDLHIHDLRGRAGVDALQAGGLESARELLGHSTQKMTSHYTADKHVPRVRPAR